MESKHPSLDVVWATTFLVRGLCSLDQTRLPSKSFLPATIPSPVCLHRFFIPILIYKYLLYKIISLNLCVLFCFSASCLSVFLSPCLTVYFLPACLLVYLFNLNVFFPACKPVTFIMGFIPSLSIPSHAPFQSVNLSFFLASSLLLTTVPCLPVFLFPKMS